MRRNSFKVSTPDNFRFWSVVYSHGWCALPPFRVDKENRFLEVVLSLSDSIHVLTSISENKGTLAVTFEAPENSAIDSKWLVTRLVSSILRLDEPLDQLYRIARKQKEFRWIARHGAGRMLRSQTVFEDVVKMICTTNCSWALTETIVGNLTRKLGVHLKDNLHAFPSPESIAAVSDTFMRKEIHSGYRSPYLLELAERIADGKLDIESWRKSEKPTPDLFADVRAIKGMGNYAAGSIMKLLGRYDYLGLDSWSRRKFYEIHAGGRKVKDATIERFYNPFGAWRGLFFWLDVTKEWYRKEFPF